MDNARSHLALSLVYVTFLKHLNCEHIFLGFADLHFFS